MAEQDGPRERKIRTLAHRLPELLGIGLLTLSLVGCAASPVERFERVSVALTQARDAGASRWAPDLLAEAEALLAAAEEEISHQTERRFSVRSFRVARLLIDDAENKIDVARVAAERAAQSAESTAVARLRDALRVVQQIREASELIPASPDTADDRAGIRADLEQLERDLAEAQARFDQGFFDEAEQLAQVVAARGERMAIFVARAGEHRIATSQGARTAR